MSFPLSKPWVAPQARQTSTRTVTPPVVQEEALRNYGSMPEFTRYALTRSSQHSVGYQVEQRPVDATVRWHDIAPLRPPTTTTFADQIEKTALELLPLESTETGLQFLRDFLQACRERGRSLDPVGADRRTQVQPRAGTGSPAEERSDALVSTLLAAIRTQGQVLPLGHRDFDRTLAARLPHMRRILETLAWKGLIPPALDWQLADYTNRLARVSQIVEREQLGSARDFCQLFVAPEPNATVARQQRDWDRRLAELPPANSAQWQLRRRAAAALAPLLNPQVAQHLLEAMQAAGR